MPELHQNRRFVPKLFIPMPKSDVSTNHIAGNFSAISKFVSKHNEINNPCTMAALITIMIDEKITKKFVRKIQANSSKLFTVISSYGI
jgi:hypothetical protein